MMRWTAVVSEEEGLCVKRVEKLLECRWLPEAVYR